ncbi:MAG: RraA family protein [Clostridia bacterium]
MKQYDDEFIRKSLYSGVICDVLDEMGYRNQSLQSGIFPLEDDTVLYGPAFTSIGTQVYTMPDDPLTAQCKVVDQLKPGEVYVLALRGEMNCAVFGELFATAVLQRKGVGVLIDAKARDLRALKTMKFPLFYRGALPTTSKGRCEINECGIPVTIDGVMIHPGDYIFGDIDGVCIIPKDIADEVITRSVVTIEKENTVRASLCKGVSLEEVYRKVGAI